MSSPFTFAVLADSHFHPDGLPAQAAWASDALFNDRNRVVAELVRRVRPVFAIHLGDVPHPVPGLAAHGEALAVAHRTYDTLGVPLHVVPGNHDVGDKPHAWLPAPGVDERKHETFRSHWGAPWRAFSHEGCRFVLIDTPVLNSGLSLEEEQWVWLENELAESEGMRIFAFLHYPLYLVSPDEPVHYDNIAEPARGRLLALFVRYRVEAAFFGHSHHFFWNRYEGTELYLAPSSAFVRPGFSELARVGPGDEFGRNDGERLGFFFVHVDEVGHRLEHVRTHGATEAPAADPAAPGRPTPPNPLGVTLRHSWDQVLDIPCDNLDPFVRKEARNDLALLATWDLGVKLLRLPLDDLRREGTRRRVADLRAHGQRAVFFTAGMPDAATWELIRAEHAIVEAVELILARSVVGEGHLPEDVPVWLSIVGRRDPLREGVYFSHFPQPGFSPGDPEIALVPESVRALVFRIGPETDPARGIAEAKVAAGGRRVVAHVWLPRGAEGVEFTDDGAVADRVEAAFHAARAFPEVTVILDTFMDHDRGYYPRHGIIDRRSNPRQAFHRLRHLVRTMA